MADLQSCYFCGTGPGGSLESYGVVPAALDPSPDEQRSVVLCPDCRDKLTALLRPVVAASGSEPPSTAPSPVAGSDAPGVDATRLPDTDDEPQQDREDPAGGQDAPPSTADGTDPSPAVTDPAGDDSGAADRTGTTDGSETADQPEAPDQGDDPGRSITFDESADDDRATGSTDTTATGDDGDTGLAGASTGTGGTTDGAAGAPDDGSDSTSPPGGPEESASVPSSASGGSGGAQASSPGGSADDQSSGSSESAGDQSSEDMLGDDNDAYRKVIRLLQNREFPVKRIEIEDLASNAYKLSPRECSDAIDAIVRKGLLVEDDGLLRRPED